MRTGMTICERYRLERRLGSGGQASVWRCQDLVTGREVAVKVVDFEEDPRKARRATREIQTLQSLTDPHTVRILDTGRDDDDHYVYIVMPVITGESLSDRLRRGSMGVADVVSIIQGVSSSLSEAHSLGICHRDVKPSNIMIHASGAAVLLDFGIASSLDQSSSLTATGTVIGTLPYMAPEVVRGEKATPASDVYALGAVMYECVSGQPPFVADTAAALLLEITKGDYPPPSCTGDLGDLIVEMLDPDPHQRPTAQDLLVRLAAIHTSITRQAAERAQAETAAPAGDSGGAFQPEPPGAAPSQTSPPVQAQGAGDEDEEGGDRQPRRTRRGALKDELMTVLTSFSFIACLLLPLALIIPLLIGGVERSIAVVFVYVWYSAGFLSLLAQAPLLRIFDRLGRRYLLRSAIGVAMNWFACSMLSYIVSSNLLLFASGHFDIPGSLHEGLGLPDSFHEILALNVKSSNILWSAASIVTLVVFLVIIVLAWVRRRGSGR